MSPRIPTRFLHLQLPSWPTPTLEKVWDRGPGGLGGRAPGVAWARATARPSARSAARPSVRSFGRRSAAYPLARLLVCAPACLLAPPPCLCPPSLLAPPPPPCSAPSDILRGDAFFHPLGALTHPALRGCGGALLGCAGRRPRLRFSLSVLLSLCIDVPSVFVLRCSDC